MPKQPAHTLIASPRNPRIMQIRKLATRKERSRSGLFFAEGIRLVAEAIRSGSEIASLIVAPELLTSDFAHDLLARQTARDIPRLEVTAAVMQSLSARQHPQGPRGGGAPALAPPRRRAAGRRVVLVALDAPQDPGNVGTILRTLDAVGGAGLILPRRRHRPASSGGRAGEHGRHLYPTLGTHGRLPSYAPGSRHTATGLPAPRSTPRATMTPSPTTPRSSCSWAASGKGYRPARRRRATTCCASPWSAASTRST